MDYEQNFQSFLDCWHKLPRSSHDILPSRKDCSPVNMGTLMSNIAIFRYDGEYQLNLIFSGSEMERLSGAKRRVRNYYDLLTDAESRAVLHEYHTILMNTPCGAYSSDVVTTKSGSTYVFETMQFPLSDSEGNTRYLLAYGHGRRPVDVSGSRKINDYTINNIKDMHYMDLGAGAPKTCIINYERKD